VVHTAIREVTSRNIALSPSTVKISELFSEAMVSNTVPLTGATVSACQAVIVTQIEAISTVTKATSPQARRDLLSSAVKMAPTTSRISAEVSRVIPVITGSHPQRYMLD